MPARKNLKGYAFEYFIRKILLYNGFVPVIPDDVVVYDDPRVGKMIHGLGQAHNADVLVTPPVQTPFYYPSRLLIECKCYQQNLGLPEVRNVLGLREDVNHFEIVTPEILRERRNLRRTATATYGYERYSYQVALASFGGFKKTAQEFAAAHRIPLISFTNSIFDSIKEQILELDTVELDERTTCQIIKFLQSKSSAMDIRNEIARAWSCRFFDEVQEFVSRSAIAVLENGQLLFLFQPYQTIETEYSGYEDGCTLHWFRGTRQSWVLGISPERQYIFELPSELLKQWKNSTPIEERREGATIKDRYFRKIILYTHDEDIQVLRLSQEFLNDVIRDIATESGIDPME